MFGVAPFADHAWIALLAFEPKYLPFLLSRSPYQRVGGIGRNVCLKCIIYR